MEMFDSQSSSGSTECATRLSVDDDFAALVSAQNAPRLTAVEFKRHCVFDDKTHTLKVSFGSTFNGRTLYVDSVIILEQHRGLPNIKEVLGFVILAEHRIKAAHDTSLRVERNTTTKAIVAASTSTTRDLRTGLHDTANCLVHAARKANAPSVKSSCTALADLGLRFINQGLMAKGLSQLSLDDAELPDCEIFNQKDIFYRRPSTRRLSTRSGVRSIGGLTESDSSVPTVPAQPPTQPCVPATQPSQGFSFP